MRPQVIQKIKYGIVIMFFFVLGMLVITTSHHVFSPKEYMEYNMCRVGSIVSSPLMPFNRTHGGTLFHTQIGGLGDQLFQWASVSSVAFQNNMTPCIRGGDLQDFFDGVGESCEEYFPWYCMREDELDKWQHLNLHHIDTVIFGRLQSYKYFDTDVRKRIQFKRQLASHATAFTKTLSEHTLVGIHVSQVGTPPIQYFENAMAFFSRQYHNVGFVVICENREWCSTQIQFHGKNVHLSQTSRHPVVEMATLANCEHIIISPGTFGWWTAYLGPDSRSQGIVVYYDQDVLIGATSMHATDFYPTHWTRIGSVAVSQPSRKFTVNRMSTEVFLGDSTIVTSYFPFVTRSSDDESIWISNVLSLQDAMIIFTSSECEDMVYNMRTHATNRTLVIVVKLQDMSVVKKYGMEFWKNQRDAEENQKTFRADHRVYITNNEKMSFVHQSIAMNPFGSAYFVWVDIGILRHTRYNGMSLITDSLMFNEDKVLMLDITTLTRNYILDVFRENEDRVGSHVFGGSLIAMERFYLEYYETISSGSYTEKFVGNDEFNMWRTCQRINDICSLIVPDSWFSSDELLLYMVPFLLHKLSTW
jgi:galactoside 2-L-fucosyltransferase 1/2